MRSLERYVSEKICPFGLRIQLFLTLGTISTDLKSKWENVLQNCSLQIMFILIGEYKNDLVKVDEEIKKVIADFERLKILPLFVLRNKKLNDHLERFNRDLISGKEN